MENWYHSHNMLIAENVINTTSHELIRLCELLKQLAPHK